MSGDPNCECEPLYAVGYRESDRLLAEAFDRDTMPIQWSAGPIHQGDCPLRPRSAPDPELTRWARQEPAAD